MPRIEEMLFWSILDEMEDDDVLSEEDQCILFLLLDDIFDDADELMFSSDESSDGWSSLLSLSDSSEDDEVCSYICPSLRFKHDSMASEKKDKKRQLNEEMSKPVAKKSMLSREAEEIKTLDSKCDREVGVKPRAPGKIAKARQDLIRRRLQARPRLPIPKKASAIKGKEKTAGDQK